MAHFLPPRDIHEQGLPKERAAVQVEVRRGRGKSATLTTMPGVHIVPAGTRMTLLPEWVEVVNSKGAKIEATGRFYVTVESLDPYHLLVDLF